MLIPNERGLDERSRCATPTAGSRRSTRSTCSCRRRRRTTRRTSTARSRSRWRALEAVLDRAARAGLRCEGVISTSFGCPYEGHVPPERVLEIAARLRDAGAAGGRLRRHHRHGQPPSGARVLRRRPRGAGRGAGADGALSQHARAGPRERARGARGGRRELRVELRRARRLPGAGRRDRQHRHRGSRLDAARRWASTPASTCRR